MSRQGGGEGLVDLHSHLVPGVDDGARTLDDAVAALDTFVASGVGHVVTTPHIDASLEASSGELDRRLQAIASGFQRLEAACTARHPDVVLGVGCEVLLDVPDPLLEDPRLHLAGSCFVLVEWPRMRVPPGTVGIVAALRQRGVVPLIAHPERYRGTGRGMALIGEWRHAGAYLQVNHGSLHGRYGKEIRERALELLRRGWVDVLASDFHGRSHLRPYVDETREWFQSRDWEALFQDLTAGNPRRILQSAEPAPIPPLDIGVGPLERLRSLLHLPGGAS